MWKRSEGWRWLSWIMNLFCLALICFIAVLITHVYFTRADVEMSDILEGTTYQQSTAFGSLLDTEMSQVIQDIEAGTEIAGVDYISNVIYDIQIGGMDYTNGDIDLIQTWMLNYGSSAGIQTPNIHQIRASLKRGGGTYQLIYAYVEDVSYSFQSNIGAVTSTLSEFGRSQGGASIYLFIDPSFQQGDIYGEYSWIYEQNAEGLFGVFILTGIGVVVFLWTLIYLLISAGHRKGSRDIFLTRTDLVSTEVYMAVWTGVNALLIACFSQDMDIGLGDLISFFILAIIEYVLLLSLLQRFVRRRKADVTYWQTSLVRRIAKGLERMYIDRKISSRTIWNALVGIVLIFMTLSAFMSGSSGFAFLCLIGFLIWYFSVVYWMMKKAVWRGEIQEGVEKIASGDIQYQIDTTGMRTDELELAEHINQLGGGLQNAVDKATKNERMKSELITNVSHDIKTPLTSIINYVDLIKREDVNNEKVKEYIHILDEKSQRLKHLTEDLVEASKANTGNLTLEMENLDLIQLLQQTLGEFEDKFEERNLQIVAKLNEGPVYVYADGRRVWRVMENLLQNVYKYALPGTRVYVDTWIKEGKIAVTIKNISENPLNIPAEELTERFIRGDVARTTEGSGLGLSIAKTLTELMKGQFFLYLDGDLFRVTVIFEQVNRVKSEEDKVQKQEYQKKESSVKTGVKTQHKKKEKKKYIKEFYGKLKP